MKLFLKLVINIAILQILSSCITPQQLFDPISTKNQLNFTLGMTEAEFDAIFEYDYIKTEFELTEIKDMSIKVRVFARREGYSQVYVAFVDNRLYYWGYPYEFNRHSDPLINKIGQLAYKKNNKN